MPLRLRLCISNFDGGRGMRYTRAKVRAYARRAYARAYCAYARALRTHVRTHDTHVQTHTKFGRTHVHTHAYGVVTDPKVRLEILSHTTTSIEI